MDLFIDDLVCPTTNDDFIDADEMPEPQNGVLIKGTFGVFNIQSDIAQKMGLEPKEDV